MEDELPIMLDYLVSSPDIDNNMIIGQMGHTDILCTEKHYHRNRKNLNHKVDIINNIPEFIAK